MEDSSNLGSQNSCSVKEILYTGCPDLLSSNFGAIHSNWKMCCSRIL